MQRNVTADCLALLAVCSFTLFACQDDGGSPSEDAGGDTSPPDASNAEAGSENDGSTSDGGVGDATQASCSKADGGGCTGTDGTLCCEVTGAQYDPDGDCLGPPETVDCFPYSPDDSMACGGCGAESCYDLKAQGIYWSANCWPGAYVVEHDIAECPPDLHLQTDNAPICD